jgi:TolB protein
MRRACVAVLAVTLGIAAASASEPRLIASDPAGGSDAAISRDGRFILTSSRRSGKALLWLYDIPQQSWRQITDGPGEDTEPSWAPDNRHAVYVSKRGGAQNLFIVDTATRDTRPLTNGANELEYPSWSPDGRMIVFTGGPWQQRNFFVVPASGGAPRAVLPQTGNVGACAFAPNPAQLVCHTYESDWGDLIEIDIATGARRKLTQESRWYYKASISPDDRWLAFTDIGDDGDTVRLMPRVSVPGHAIPAPRYAGRWPLFADEGRTLFFHRQVDEGTALRLLDRVTGSSETIDTGDWQPGRASRAPDGTRIAFCGMSKAGRSGVIIYERATGRRSTLPLAQEACFPAWSPDGAILAISVKSGERWEVATVRADGTDLRILTTAGPGLHQLNGPIAWSPDSRKLAFTGATRPYESDLFVADLASGAVTNVTNDHWYDEGPAFTPDGRALTFMSTRGGDWSWGLFELDLDSGRTNVALKPDFIERRHPVRLAGNELWWVETNSCLSTTFVMARRGEAAPEAIADLAGARWFDVSADGRYLLATIANRRVEYWRVDFDGAQPTATRRGAALR